MKPAMTSLPYTGAPSDPYAAWNPIPHKRMTPPMAQDTAKKPKTSSSKISDRIPDAVIANIPEDLLARVHLTREDLKLSLEEQTMKTVMGFKQAESDEEDIGDIDFDKPEYGPDDPLPQGYEWSPFCSGTGDKDYIVMIDCFICGVGMDHWPAQCPKKRAKASHE